MTQNTLALSTSGRSLQMEIGGIVHYAKLEHIQALCNKKCDKVELRTAEQIKQLKAALKEEQENAVRLNEQIVNDCEVTYSAEMDAFLAGGWQ